MRKFIIEDDDGSKVEEHLQGLEHLIDLTPEQFDAVADLQINEELNYMEEHGIKFKRIE